MASNLVVRNIEASVIQALKQSAVRHGRSAEAEHREILRAALLHLPRRPLAEVITSMPNVGNDEDFDARG